MLEKGKKNSQQNERPKSMFMQMSGFVLVECRANRDDSGRRRRSKSPQRMLSSSR